MFLPRQSTPGRSPFRLEDASSGAGCWRWLRRNESADIILAPDIMLLAVVSVTLEMELVVQLVG